MKLNIVYSNKPSLADSINQYKDICLTESFMAVTQLGKIVYYSVILYVNHKVDNLYINYSATTIMCKKIKS